MNSFVLDASATLAWCFEDERTAPAASMLERLRDQEALVPPLWLLELANGLVVAERRGRITRAESTRFLGMGSSPTNPRKRVDSARVGG